MVAIAIAAVVSVVAIVAAIFIVTIGRDRAKEERVELERERDTLNAALSERNEELSQATLSLADAQAREQQVNKLLESTRQAHAELAHELDNCRNLLQDWSESLLGVERLRRHREWSILTGPSLSPPLPHPDTSGPVSELLSSLAVELEAIREEVGTVTQLQSPTVPTSSIEPYLAALLLRAGTELLRRLAPGCEELLVSMISQPDMELFELEVQAVGARSTDESLGQSQAIATLLTAMGVTCTFETETESTLLCRLLIPICAGFPSESA